VVLVGAVITINVALGGMKGITLVQAFQYWAKMFAISLPIFVLMGVYGSYGKQVGQNSIGAAAAAVVAGDSATEPQKPGSIEARKPMPEKAPKDGTWLNPFGTLTTKAAKAAKLSVGASKTYSLLYTYSLIIALVCGTAGLPHILVRFYTNPNGVAAKRTTMWVMILIGVFYLFPPVFGVLGRNLLPELYAGVGAKGTDKIVLELPRLLNEKYAPFGSILSGITCAGAFAAFMSTFSGLLVSMTGALAHDVYGRMLRPKSTPDQRMRAFRICAVVVGGIAIILGMQVEPFQINFMVGQAFAIAAASYFPLLFMSAWWRGMTMKGAATGMLAGGLLALTGITLTSFTDLEWLPLDPFWAGHPLGRILCEQPAIWTVPLAILLMVIVSKATKLEVPSDIRMKMLVLHAPEALGLKQEYIQEHHRHGGAGERVSER
jgi:Na+(H+)/acetate symporter ActP